MEFKSTKILENFLLIDGPRYLGDISKINQ